MLASDKICCSTVSPGGDEKVANPCVITDRQEMDVDAVWHMLRCTYWALDRTREAVERSICNSACVGIFVDGRQIAFARAMTDTIHALVFDVIVHPDYRGCGFGKLLMKTILSHPELESVGQFILTTRDAHGLYRQFGFTVSPRPNDRLELRRSLVAG